MGYTHYFPQNRPFSDMEWSQITKAFRKLADSDECKDLIQPEINCGWTDFFTHESIKGEAIAFNGVEDDACETFVLEKSPESLDEFIFCKTNRRPYDKMVTAMLIVCAGYAEGALSISSDGTAEEWEEGVELVTRVLKKPTRIQFLDDHLHVSSPSAEEIEEAKQKEEFEKSLSNKKEKGVAQLSVVKNEDGSTQ